MAYPSIQYFSYRDLQKLAKIWRITNKPNVKIDLRVSKQNIYDRLISEGILFTILEPILVYLPPEIIEHILSYTDDNVNTAFALSCKMWQTRSQAWWTRRYYQLGYVIPSDNIIPIKLLHNQVAPIYGNTLVQIPVDSLNSEHGSEYFRYDIPLSSSLLISKFGTIGVKTHNNTEVILDPLKKSITVPNIHYNGMAHMYIDNGELWCERKQSKTHIELEHKVVKILFVFKGDLIYVILTSNGMVFISNVGDGINPVKLHNIRISLVNARSVRDIIGTNHKVWCLTYDNQLYEMIYINRTIVYNNVDIPPGIIISVTVTGSILYYIIRENLDSKTKVYYKNIYLNGIHIIDTGDHDDIKYITDLLASQCNPYRLIVFTSHNQLYITRLGTNEVTHLSVNLRRIVSVCGLGKLLYILGMK